MRVLLVEDNLRLSQFVCQGLAEGGFAVDAAASGADAEAALETVTYDTMILDLGLPDIDGMTLIAKLRQRKNGVPILVLTARDGLNDRVAGLNAGADDYLLKPFAMEELIARLRALQRRPGDTLGTVLTEGNTRLDVAARECLVSDQTVPLSRREIDVLEQLMRKAGRVLPKTTIDEKTYGFGGEVSPNSVEVIVSRLRKKLVQAGADVEILTFRGVGYMLRSSGK